MLDQKQIADLTDLLKHLSDTIPAPTVSGSKGQRCQETERLIECARDEQRRRANRAKLFNVSKDFFSDPAWDILLELFVADLTKQRLSPSIIGLDTGIPPSTVLRWLTLMENSKLVYRRRDKVDRRRYWISLTDHAHATIEKHFS